MSEHDSLALAFPAFLHARVVSILDELQVSSQRSPDDIAVVTLKGERLRIPARVYLAEPNWSRVACLDAIERSIVGCLFSRHHDGYVRERALDHLPLVDESWVAPFVIQLLGDYVLEIVERAARIVSGLPASGYAAFVDENPQFLEVTAARATSYWNEYHRQRFQSRGDYPAFSAIDRLWQSRSRREPPSW